MNLLALAAVARRYAKFDRRRRAVAGSDRHALHRLRIAFKRYRYAVEVAAPALPNDAQSTLSNMKEFQEQLGAIQDASVLIETLERVTRARRKRHLASKAAIEALKLSRSERVEATLAALTAQVTAEPPAFSEIFS